MAEPLKPEDQGIVDDEVAMAARVGRRIADSLAQAPLEKPGVTIEKRAAAEAEMVALRDQIGEARAEDVPALLAQMMRTAGVRAVDGPRVALPADPRSPYFGHMRLREGGRTRDVLIGRRGMIDRRAGVVIVDWRDAPVSRLYYRYDEGDDYEEELGQQVREGSVEVRRTLSFADGELLRVRCPAGTFVKNAATSPGGGNGWTVLAGRAARELVGGVGKAERAPSTSAAPGKLGALGDVHLRPDKHLPEIAALIDRNQFAATTEADSGVVILQGGAGSGKTTVALHRVAWLAFEDPKRFRPAHMIVVVGQPQLGRYVERLLPSLDVAGVKVAAYVPWAQAALHKLVGKMQKRVIDDVPSDVARLKKHPAMLDAVRIQVSRAMDTHATTLAAALAGRPGAADVPAQPAGAPVPALAAQRLALDAATHIPEDTRARAKKAITATLDELNDLVRAHEELITDRSLLSCAMDEKYGEHAMDARTLDDVLVHTARQAEEVVDDSDIDIEARLPIDDGDDDPTESRGALDIHDLPVLLCMWIARHGDLGSVQYDHVVVDEAQDLSATELVPLLIAAGPGQSATLAGDVVQKVLFDNGYDRWEELTDQLAPYLRKGVRAVEPFRLSYRSTAEVVAFGREVLGPLAPAEPPEAVRTGAPVECFAFHDGGEEIAFLAEQLRSLMGREPTASVALLCRYPERARFYTKMLAQAEVPRLRLVLPADERGEGDDFTFSPGIDVTTISRVKGLEYDYVVIVEVTEAMYPDQVVARHLLHIGATRAAHQLWLTTSFATPSPLLPPGLIDEP